jgi:AcrR family transcriptional regulator
MARLTRKEQQARTRACLLHSAAKVFAHRGLQQASIDEVAEDAGFTKGAFYANFKSKEELFLAMLDERFAERLEAIDRIAHGPGEVEQQAREGGLDFARYIAADPEWQRLFFEFTAYAARNPDFRAELVTRYRAIRERMAAIIAERCDELGVTPAVPPEDVAVMICAMGNGFALERLLEPEVAPDELYGSMLAILFGGLRSLSEVEDAATAQRAP